MESESTALTPRHESTEISVDTVLKRIASIEDLMKRAMRPTIDYGTIPGTNSKPTLLKPGAEKLCVMFRFAPEYKTDKTFHADGHLTVECTCRILDLGGAFLGEASAMCSTRESKYAYRKAERVCPQCGKPSVIKGKAEFGGGWLCWKKKNGCGAKFNDGDPTIETQKTDRVPNEDIADSYNTVLRIAEKRALIGAVRLVTGSSALFDEEIPGTGGNERDADHHEPSGNGQQQEAPPQQQSKSSLTIGTSKRRDAWIESITKWVATHRLDSGKVREAYGVVGFDDVPVARAQELVDRLKSNPPEWREVQESPEREPGAEG